MSANPFAALGEDGPNPVAAKGAKFLSFFFPGTNVNWHFALFWECREKREERDAICKRNRRARALREIYFRLKPIETDEYTFYTFESICFKGICALNRRHNLADAVQSDRANPLFLGGGGCSFLSSPQFFLFFRGGCWWEKRALFSLHRKINI